MKFLRSLIAHLRYHREVYLFPAAAVIMTIGAIAGVPLLTGRSVIDDPAAIVGMLYNACGIVIAAALVGQVQTHLFGYRAEREPLNPSLADDLHDSCVTIVLFLLFSWLLFCR